MDKNINKERAIQLLVGFRNYLTSGNPIWGIDDVSKAFDMAIKALERQHGEWIEDEEQNHVEITFHCSECGYKAWGIEETTNFCPNCGADMRGDDD